MAYIPVAQRNSAPNTGGAVPPVTSSGYVPVAQRQATAPVAPTTPTNPVVSTSGYVPVAQRQATPVVAKAPSTSILTKIDNATQTPAEGTPAAQSTLKQLPSSIAENLPFGVGAIIKQARENPEDVANLSASDFLKGTLDTAKGLVKGVVGAASNLAMTPVKFNIPGLGEVTNRQFNTAQRIQNGENSTSALLEEGSGAIFDTLMLVGLGEKVFGGRPVTVAKTDIPEDAGITVKNAPKSGRLYEEPTYTHPITADMLEKMKSDGTTFTKTPDPKLPTYFKMTGQANGNITGEIVQIKPSYFDTFKSKLGGDISKVPEEGLVPLATKSTSLAALDAAKAEPLKLGAYNPVATRTPVAPISTSPEPVLTSEAVPTKAIGGIEIPKPVTTPVEAPEPLVDQTALAKANPQLYRHATNAPTVDKFIDAVVKSDKTTRDHVSIPALTDFYNKVERSQATVPHLEKQLVDAYKSAGHDAQMPEFHKADQVLSEIEAELDTARPGERVFTGYGKDAKVERVPSTFPQWIPDHLRSSELFSKVMGGLDLNNLKYPEGNRPKQRELYNELLNEVDHRLGVDTKAIRDQIITQHNENNQKGEVEKTRSGSVARREEPRTEEKPVTSKEEVKIPDVSKIKPAVGAPQRESSIQLRSELIPGATEFVTKDLIPKTKEFATWTKELSNWFARGFNPVGQAPVEGVDIIMKHKGTFEGEVFRLEQVMKNIKKMWDKQSPEARLDFMAKIENGESVPEEYKELATMYRERFDHAYKAIEQYKDVPFVENFFPHFWEKPGEMTPEVVAKFAKRPLQGSRSFLKQRVFSTIEEGIKAGYKPVSTNPEELTQIYEANVKKFVMAQGIKEDMLEKGLWKFVKDSAEAPSDFARIDDTIARVYFPTKTESSGTIVAKGGEYWAQKDVARLINNYLSKDFINDTPLGKGLMKVKNTLNAFQLGFSAFHLTMETLDTVITKMSIGISKLAGGNLAGLKDIAAAPMAPFNYFRSGQKFYNGDPELLKIENDLFTGGASLRQKQYYKNSVFENFTTAVREGNYLGAVVRAPLASIEGLMRPLFSYYIPRLKVGAFRDLFAAELERQSAKIESGKTTQAKVAREVWNNIENRMGELNYDNLFWNKNLKASLMLTFRAVGWNVGTVRELGGGIAQDIPKQAYNLLARNGEAEFTPKMSYTLSIFTVIAALGAMYQYLHTGKKPSELRDLFYPQNGATDKSGEAYRVEFPSYLKDLYQFSHSPVKTVGNKMAPELSMIIDLMTNKDYYDNYIRNTNDNLSTQTKQVALFMATQFEAFTIQNIANMRKGKATGEQQIESFLGIIKAPSDVIKSDYQKEIANLYSDQMGGHAPQTPEMQANNDRKSAARIAIKNGDYSALNQLVKDKIITPTGRAAFVRNARLTSDQRMLKGLSKDNKAKLRATLQPEQ